MTLAARGLADRLGVRQALIQAPMAGSPTERPAFLACQEATSSALHRAALLGQEPAAVKRLLSGRPDFSPLWAGQNRSTCATPLGQGSAAELARSLLEAFEDA